MREFLRRALLDNLIIKGIAMLLAVALFIVVRGDRDTTISFYLPVAYTESGERVMTSRPVDAVRVTVVGSWARLRRFDGRSLEPLRVDLGRLSDGDFVFEADGIDLPPGLRVTAINPPAIRLHFEERAEKTVAVRVQTSGAVAHGYRVEGTEVAPAEVTVRGAGSVIEALSELRTSAVPLDGRSATFEARVPLAPPDAYVTVTDDRDVVVTVRIGEELGVHRLAAVPVRVRAVAGAAPVRAGVHTQPERVSITLRGPRNALEVAERARLSAHVTWHAEDDRLMRSRPARVVVEGVPPGVAIEVSPREVTLLPKK